MTTTLTDKAKALIQSPVIASVATVDAKGHPQVTPVWIDLEGESLVFNTVRGRAKVNNLDENPYVAISVIDPTDPYNVVVVRGWAEVVEENADAHIDVLAKKYLGVDSYPKRRPGEVRLKYKVTTENVVMQAGDE